MDLLSNCARDEVYKRVLDSISELILVAEDVVLEKESFSTFTNYIRQIQSLVQELHAERVETRAESGPMRTALQMLESDIKKAGDIIKSYKLRGRFSLLLNSRSLLPQLQRSASEIARAVDLLSLANLDSGLKLKSKIVEIVNGMESLEFKSAASTEAIISEIEKSITENGRTQEDVKRLLDQIAEAVGASTNASLMISEIELLKKDKEEMEARKQQAEALQLSQLIHLLYRSDAMPAPSESLSTVSLQDLIVSFSCPLSGQLMEDPVAILCGHSFERKPISDRFERGERSCPVCKEELASLELTANISLRNSIQEWKRRNTTLRLQKVISGFNSIETEVLHKALDDLQDLIGAPECISELSRQSLVPKLVELMKSNSMNTRASLKCLRYLSRYSDENKEAIAEGGAIRCIIKRFCRGEIELDAIEILLTLSEKEMFAEKIGNTKDSIPILVSLLQNPNLGISQKALTVLRNLSSNPHFVIKMAEAGFFQPFMDQFNQGTSLTRCSMATTLPRIQLSESTAEKFADESFIGALTKMLYSGCPSCKSSCLLCIKKLISFHEPARQFLSYRDMIPALLGMMYSSISEPHWKLEATEILTSLVRISQSSDYNTNMGLQELHSQHNIDAFLKLIPTSVPQIKAALLRFLLLMVQKSEKARDLIHSDQITSTILFNTVEGDQHSEVRLQALKLIHCVAEDTQSEIQLPPSPSKENIVTVLVKILTGSPNTEERTAAAGIISRLPEDDITIDEMLCKAKSLKAIAEVISASSEGRQVVMMKDPLTTAEDSSLGLLESSLAALLRHTKPNKPELQKQVRKLEIYPSLVRVLNTGSPVAKQRAAVALAHLSQSMYVTMSSFTALTEETNLSPLIWLTKFLRVESWCCNFSATVDSGNCFVHGSACSSRQTFCLIKDNAVKPLVRMLSVTEAGASEAAFVALDTLLMDERMTPDAARVIVENEGIEATLEVLEKGPLSAKEKALDLFQKLFRHSRLTKVQYERSKGILIHLLQVDSLKKKIAFLLSQMGVIPQQSSYF